MIRDAINKILEEDEETEPEEYKGDIDGITSAEGEASFKLIKKEMKQGGGSNLTHKGDDDGYLIEFDTVDAAEAFVNSEELSKLVDPGTEKAKSWSGNKGAAFRGAPGSGIERWWYFEDDRKGWVTIRFA